MVPLSRVERVAFETLASRNFWKAGMMKLANSRDQIAAGELSLIGPHRPSRIGIIIMRGFQFSLELHIAAQIMLGRKAFHIVQDLRLLGPSVIPLRIQRIGIGIEARFHITFCAGIGILSPSTAEALCFLKNKKIIPPRFFQIMRHRHTAETRADYNRLIVIWHGEAPRPF